jgi:CUG-BP- and ETR3-like factor
MLPYGGQYYPATSPGPPIQTTASNKGPDGANLFIFHIPNHFTNLDMYNLFCHYGNLLSVRIMVEKDTGRSRGFGFVSYDTPEAAALAIKELNGFAIGNKRLKVQHKQIRPSDQQYDRNHQNSNHGTYDMGPGSAFGRGHMSPSLPPSGPMAMKSSWYNRGNSGTPTSVELGVSSEQQQQLSEEGCANNQNADASTASSDQAGSDPNNSPLPSSLADMEPLRQTLPEVGSGSNE